MYVQVLLIHLSCGPVPPCKASDACLPSLPVGQPACFMELPVRPSPAPPQAPYSHAGLPVCPGRRFSIPFHLPTCVDIFHLFSPPFSFSCPGRFSSFFVLLVSCYRVQEMPMFSLPIFNKQLFFKVISSTPCNTLKLLNGVMYLNVWTCEVGNIELIYKFKFLFFTIKQVAGWYV